MGVCGVERMGGGARSRSGGYYPAEPYGGVLDDVFTCLVGWVVLIGPPCLVLSLAWMNNWPIWPSLGATTAALAGGAISLRVLVWILEARANGRVSGPQCAGDGGGGSGGGRRRFRCQACPAGPFDEDEAGFAGKRLMEYRAGKGLRIEWESEG